MGHKSKCSCFACSEGVEALHKKQNELLDKFGWYIHCVTYEKPKFGKIFANHHTHGLPENFKHRDFQIVVPLDPNVIEGIFHNLCERVMDGETFMEGSVVTGVIQLYPIKLIPALDNCRPVLRIILPDDDGKIERDVMTTPFRHQYDI